MTFVVILVYFFLVFQWMGSTSKLNDIKNHNSSYCTQYCTDI